MLEKNLYFPTFYQFSEMIINPAHYGSSFGIEKSSDRFAIAILLGIFSAGLITLIALIFIRCTPKDANHKRQEVGGAAKKRLQAQQEQLQQARAITPTKRVEKTDEQIAVEKATQVLESAKKKAEDAVSACLTAQTDYNQFLPSERNEPRCIIADGNLQFAQSLVIDTKKRVIEAETKLQAAADHFTQKHRTIQDIRDARIRALTRKSCPNK